MLPTQLLTTSAARYKEMQNKDKQPARNCPKLFSQKYHNNLRSFEFLGHTPITSPQILYFLKVKAKTMLLLLKCSLMLISCLCWCPGGRVWRLYGRGWCDRSVSPAHHDCRCSVSSEDTGPQPDPVHCCSAANSHTDTDTSTGHNHSPDMNHYIISLKNSNI